MFGLYEPLLFAHSWTRWIVFIGATVLGGRAAMAARRRDEWQGVDNYLMWVYSFTITFQVLFGLSLYLFVSPLTHTGFRMGAESMKVPVLRFWLVEHGVAMLLAFIFYQVGYRWVRKSDRADKYRKMALTFGAVCLLMVLGMPWPFLAYGRPLFRLPVW